MLVYTVYSSCSLVDVTPYIPCLRYTASPVAHLFPALIGVLGADRHSATSLSTVRWPLMVALVRALVASLDVTCSVAVPG